jgi:hypothetical protein
MILSAIEARICLACNNFLSSDLAPGGVVAGDSKATNVYLSAFIRLIQGLLTSLAVSLTFESPSSSSSTKVANQGFKLILAPTSPFRPRINFIPSTFPLHPFPANALSLTFLSQYPINDSFSFPLTEASLTRPDSASKHFLPRRPIDNRAGDAIFSFGSFNFSSSGGRN